LLNKYINFIVFLLLNLVFLPIIINKIQARTALINGGSKMAETKNAKDVLEFVNGEKNRIEFVQLLCADILGDIRGFTIPKAHLKSALEDGKGIDGSSLEGLVRIEESDLVLKPDPATFRVWPWDFQFDGTNYRVGLMFGDILNPDGSHNAGDTRFVLKNVLGKARKMGFSDFFVGPELEFFIFPMKDGKPVPKPVDNGSYFSMGGSDPHSSLRMSIQLALSRMGIETGNPIETNYDHHEVAPGQHEIDLQHLNALEMADVAMIHKFITKEIARKEGLYATFMPKPIFGENGSGMHVHQSLWKGNTNKFFSNDENQHHLSDTALHYVAGLFRHVNDISAVLCQWINSYKRLVPGYEAPVYHAIGTRNRSALIRVPEYEPGKEHATRIELRCPDPACNPYLAFALMLAAGLDGIEKKMPHNKFIGNESMYDLTEKQLKSRGIKTLPGSLAEALELFKNSKLARKTMGEHLFSKFVENKEKELKDYSAWLSNYCANNKARPEDFRLKITGYEYEHYLPRL